MIDRVGSLSEEQTAMLSGIIEKMKQAVAASEDTETIEIPVMMQVSLSVNGAFDRDEVDDLTPEKLAQSLHELFMSHPGSAHFCDMVDSVSVAEISDINTGKILVPCEG